MDDSVRGRRAEGTSGENWNDFGESGGTGDHRADHGMDANPRPDNWAKAALPRREKSRESR